jgi:transcriptional repressor NrdR
MVCPFCQSTTGVYNSRSRPQRLVVWRRRRCGNCREAFTTYERIDLSYLVISKRNGQTEPYARAKLFTSIYRAQLDPIASNDLTDTVEFKLLRASQTLLGSRDIARVVTETLGAFDPSSAARYSSFLP